MDKAHPAPGAGPFALAWFLASLAFFFAAGIVGYLAVRVPAVDWGAGLPPFPDGLQMSTIVLVISSGTIHLALQGARRGDAKRLQRGMLVTTLLGAVFLVMQVICWQQLFERAGAPAIETLYGLTFYILTMLHALHVVGGLIPLMFTTVRAYRGAYGPEEHTGVLMCAMYWHFLDVVWLILFLVLVVIG